jgi:hypothetical protein
VEQHTKGKVEKIMEQSNIELTELPTCIVCLKKDQPIGIHIWKQFICKECEGEMVMTDVKDQKYPFFIKQMKKIWLKENA